MITVDGKQIETYILKNPAIDDLFKITDRFRILGFYDYLIEIETPNVYITVTVKEKHFDAVKKVIKDRGGEEYTG